MATNQTVPAIAVLPGNLGDTQSAVAEKIGNELNSLYQLSMTVTNSSTASQKAAYLQAANPIVQINPDGAVAFEAIAKSSTASLRKELEAIGVRVNSEFGKVLGGSVAAEQLGALASLPSLQFVRPVYRPITNVGSVQNEADASMRSDIAKTRFNVDGGGVKIGVLSDSWNSTGTANNGIASGDLPGPGNPNGFTTPVQILQETPLTNRSDEGRAMLELIHDIAPAAPLAFHSADGGPAAFAQGIIDLADAGADVIVDDVTYFAEPFFQDGVIAQAATSVVGRGIPFFSSAGNQGNESYESVFRSGIQATIGNAGPYDFHDFDPGPGVDIAQFVAVAAGRTAVLSFQWDQPFASAGGPGSANDMDIFAFDQNGALVAVSANSNIGNDAVEVLRIQNSTNSSQFYDIVFGHNLSKGGPKPGYVKYYGTGHPLVFDAFEYNTFSGTIFGHHGISAGAGIAAAPYFKTPAFGVTPAFPQDTTSEGGVPVLFSPAGVRLAAPEFRQQPRITAPDETNNTFFGEDTDNDGKPNFAGTSAAAPHVAAVAALMLDAAGGPGTLTPQQIYSALEQTASDMLAPGFDLKTGHGFINAEAAIAEVASTAPPVINGTSGNDQFVLTYDFNTSSGNVTITRASNGGTPVNLGSFPVIAGITVNGGGGTDSIRFNTSNFDDVIEVRSTGIVVNGSTVVLKSIEQRTLAGRNGSDKYRFDTDAALGSYNLLETGTSLDTIDFSPTTTLPVRFNLGLSTAQTVNANLSLKLNSASTFEYLFGGAKDDVLTGNNSINRIEGRAGNDTIDGSGNDDTLVGGLGNDTYVFTDASTAETDTITEQVNQGIDTLSFASLTTAVTVDLGLATVQQVHLNRRIKLSKNNVIENVIGGSKGDTLIGNSLNNRLEGRLGNDKLTGKAGDDVLVGNLGDDIYIFANASTTELDVVSEAANQGQDTLSFAAVTNSVKLDLGLTTIQQAHTNRRIRLNSAVGVENIIGGSANDTLIGNSLNNVIVGLGGRDSIKGVAGNNVLIGGNGVDTVLGGTGSDILIAGVTSFDTKINQLNLIVKEWGSSRTYTQRVTQLRNGVGTPLTSLKAKNTVRTDANPQDQLRGNGNLDWYFAATDDAILDLANGELKDAL